MAEDRKKPTSAQRDFVLHLLNELGYDPQEYDLDGMTRVQMSRLIDELRDELEG